MSDHAIHKAKEAVRAAEQSVKLVECVSDPEDRPIMRDAMWDAVTVAMHLASLVEKERGHGLVDGVREFSPESILSTAGNLFMVAMTGDPYKLAAAAESAELGRARRKLYRAKCELAALQEQQTATPAGV